MPPNADILLPDRLRYEQLTTKHPKYDAERIQSYEDLYEGGHKIARRADKYLTQLPGESEVHFRVRCKTVAYQAFMGSIIDQFASDLLTQPITITAAADANDPATPGDPPDKVYYPRFEKDADAAGHAFVEVVRKVLTSALLHRRGYLCIDAPEASPEAPPATNLAEEEARGTRDLYVYRLPFEQLTDFACDERGNFTWAILAKREIPRDTPLVMRGTIHETFTVWTMRGEFAHWDRYEVRFEPDKPPQPLDMIPRTGQGSTTFRGIPILTLTVPKGLWVGSKLADMAKEHWQRRSSLVAGQSRSLLAIAILKLGSEFGPPDGALPSEIQQNSGRHSRAIRDAQDKGWMVIGAGDDARYAEPSGSCYEVVAKDITTLKEAMHQVSHQMAASLPATPSALGRSGLSKQKDQDATSRVLTALGDLVRRFATRVYDAIAQARGEDVIWHASGLDHYENENREALLEEAVGLDQVPIPSVTYRKAAKTVMAERLLPGIDPQTLAQIKQEIEEGVEAEEEMRVLSQKAQKDAILNPKPPPPPGPPNAATPPEGKVAQPAKPATVPNGKSANAG